MFIDSNKKYKPSNWNPKARNCSRRVDILKLKVRDSRTHLINVLNHETNTFHITVHLAYHWTPSLYVNFHLLQLGQVRFAPLLCCAPWTTITILNLVLLMGGILESISAIYNTTSSISPFLLTQRCHYQIRCSSFIHTFSILHKTTTS